MNKKQEKIKAELDKIRPFLNGHGGDVEILDFDNNSGVLNLRFTGRCATCPMSKLTYESMIKTQLSHIKDIQFINLIT